MTQAPDTSTVQHSSFLVRAFWPLIALIAVAKLALAHLIPLTGDEAYFDLWARYPAFGYYDHPPMVGWWLMAIQGMPPVILRLPGVFVSFLPGLIILWLFGRSHPVAARLSALIALSMPLFMFGVGISTDTPVVLFGILALAFAHKASDTRRNLFWVLAGMALGLAFLSKYFAVLLGIGIATHIVLRHRPWPLALRAIALLIVGAMPAVAVNLWWNYCNCWYNLQFNLISRNTSAGFSPEGAAVYLAMLAYVLMPWVLWALWRHRAALRQSPDLERVGLWVTAGLVGLGLLGVLSLFRSVGLHWLAAFLPAIMLVLPVLPIATLRRLAYASLGFAGLHLIVVIGILSLSPVQLTGLLGRAHSLATLTFYRHPEQIAAQVATLADGRPVFTHVYSYSAVLTHYMDETVSVFGAGSRYGRQYDMITDFQALDGADLAILLFRLDRAAEFGAYFAQFDVTLLGQNPDGPWVLRGDGFDFAQYRENVLRPIAHTYYRLPAWLPAGRCDFLTRYDLALDGA